MSNLYKNIYEFNIKCEIEISKNIQNVCEEKESNSYVIFIHLFHYYIYI